MAPNFYYILGNYQEKEHKILIVIYTKYWSGYFVLSLMLGKKPE